MVGTMIQLVLASASPRRKQLLEHLNLSFLTVSTDVDESRFAGEAAVSYVKRLSTRKAQAAIGLLADESQNRLIIGSDTTVAIGERIFGKPATREEAGSMLEALSGNWHQVHTGVSAIFLGGGMSLANETIVVSTAVKFRSLTKQEISDYVSTGEPFDKAGAYGIQGRAAAFVERIEGSYTGVVGLPLSQTHELIERVSRAALK